MSHPQSLGEQSVRVFIVEDQGMFRAFLENWFGQLEGFEVVGAFETAEDALRRTVDLRPHLAVLDLQLPGMDGIALSHALRQLNPAIRTLLLTSLMDPLTVTRVRESGVEGFVEKDASPDELLLAIRSVASGDSHFSTGFRQMWVKERNRPDALGKVLSRREQQILALLLNGKTNRDIASDIGLSPRTVEFHRANLMSKLGATNIHELLHQARQRGFHP